METASSPRVLLGWPKLNVADALAKVEGAVRLGQIGNARIQIDKHTSLRVPAQRILRVCKTKQ